MFIQKNSDLLKNDTAKNMTQNQWRSLLIVLVNLLIIAGVMVFGGELVLAEDNPTVEPNICLLPGCPIICDPIEICFPNPPAEPGPTPDFAEPRRCRGYKKAASRKY